MLRNLASSLFLTLRDNDYYDIINDTLAKPMKPPKTKGRVITTLQKAKEVRSLIEKCITIARHSLPHLKNADEFATDADRHTPEWKEWRNGEQWQKWNAAIAPAVTARRRAIQMLGDREAVDILFDEVAIRFADRDGGYTRVMRLAKPRLGDAGTRAILEFVGVNDRQAQRSDKPAFSDEETPEEETAVSEEASEETAETEAEETASAEESTEEGSTEGEES